MKTTTRTIVLAGAMGSGKSTLGRRLASDLDLPFVDIDAEVARDAAMTIPELFETYGEQHFRQLEQRATLAALRAPGFRVVALGGGAVMHESVRHELREHRDTLCSIWLRISPELAAHRIEQEQGGRPLWNNGGRTKWEALLAQRTPWYAECHHHLDVDGRTLDELAREVADVC